MSDAKTIFKAEVVGKDIQVTIGTKHLPSLIYAAKLIDMHIMDMLVEQEIMKAAVNQPKILTPKPIVEGFKLS